MSLAQILASLMGGDEAEAKQYYVSESGKVPKDIPLNFKQKSLADVLGKEPSSPQEYRQFLQDEFQRRMEQNARLPESRQQSTGNILNAFNNELLTASLGKMEVTRLQDVVPKTLNALNVSPEQQAKMNQMYITDPTPLNKAGSFSPEGLTIPTTPSNLGTGIAGIKASKKELSQDIQSPKNRNFFNVPVKPKMSITEGETVSPMAKVRLYPQYPEKAASGITHELLHSLYPGISDEVEQFDANLPSDITLDEALKQTGFMGHFPQETLDDQPIYGLHGNVAKITHPEWYKEAKKEALKKIASPIPEEE